MSPMPMHVPACQLSRCAQLPACWTLDYAATARFTVHWHQTTVRKKPTCTACPDALQATAVSASMTSMLDRSHQGWPTPSDSYAVCPIVQQCTPPIQTPKQLSGCLLRGKAVHSVVQPQRSCEGLSTAATLQPLALGGIPGPLPPAGLSPISKWVQRARGAAFATAPVSV